MRNDRISSLPQRWKDVDTQQRLLKWWLLELKRLFSAGNGIQVSPQYKSIPLIPLGVLSSTSIYIPFYGLCTLCLAIQLYGHNPEAQVMSEAYQILRRVDLVCQTCTVVQDQHLDTFIRHRIARFKSPP